MPELSMLKYQRVADEAKIRERRQSVQDVQDVSNSPTIFESTELPMNDDNDIDLNYMASVGNGHLCTTIYSDTVYVNGLYNDKLGVSHRARIPSKNAIRVSFDTDIEEDVTRRYFLDVEQGVWHEESAHLNFKVTVRIFAHRYYNRLLVTQVQFERLGSNTDDITVTLTNNEGSETDDINFGTEEDYTIGLGSLTCKKRDGRTKVAETRYSGLSTVSQYYTVIDTNLVFTDVDVNKTYNYITSIDQNDNVAQSDFDDAILSIEADEGDELLALHVQKWKDTWNNGRIEVDDVQLGKLIYGSFYYILSSLPTVEETNNPKNQFFGLSPGGLANGAYLRDYQGHSFWDTETWMYPTIMMFYPNLGKDMLSYRWYVRYEAMRRANCNWHTGTRYPWESAFSGAETTPDCCVETRENQQHITSDIAFAARQYISATRDVDWLNDWGCEFTREIANFWQSRVTYNEERDAWELLGVMPPDEYHGEVDNSIYTNVGASLAIFLANYASCLCGDEPLPEDWISKARNMTYIFDNENMFHPEYEGYPIGEEIKQADVVLLGFPMMWEMSNEVRQNDLDMYEPVTDPFGPAMTWGMHCIGHLELENYDKAEDLYDRSYSLYMREPYKVGRL
ncbi:protein-glucosylgalactosylhydroxylysine glucosidase-like [Glandiceps talaboti]